MDLKNTEKIVLCYSSVSDEEETCKKIFPNDNNEKLIRCYLNSLHEEEQDEEENTKAKPDKIIEKNHMNDLK